MSKQLFNHSYRRITWLVLWLLAIVFSHCSCGLGDGKARPSNLLNKGAQVNDSGSTPLHLAAEKGYLKIVKILLDKGAEINKIYGRSKTALCKAAQSGHTAVVKELLDRGADLGIGEDDQ